MPGAAEIYKENIASISRMEKNWTECSDTNEHPEGALEYRKRRSGPELFREAFDLDETFTPAQNPRPRL